MLSHTWKGKKMKINAAIIAVFLSKIISDTLFCESDYHIFIFSIFFKNAFFFFNPYINE